MRAGSLSLTARPASRDAAVWKRVLSQKAPAVAIAGITVLAGALRLAHLGGVPGNPYYDAAVHTMSQSWHAFLFGALDPSGMVAVDKPPVDLWLQVAAVKVLGYHSTALKLPQALAGTIAVPLLYDLVRRAFGRGAGVASAAALAVMPVAVMTARSDTMDTVMMALLVASAWLAVIAVERDRLLPLLGAGALAGLAFNVKLFEALLPLPAIALVWLAGSAAPVRRRIAWFGAACAVTVVVAFAWVVPVALTPASQRPYPIGSTDGSIWNLVFVFNGVDRLSGRPAGTPDTLPPGAKVPAGLAKRQLARAKAGGNPAGPKRLFGRRFAPRIGSALFPAMLLGALAALAGAAAGIARRRTAAEHGARLQAALALAIGAWLAAGFVLFSFSGAFHPRYLEAITPAIAAALGIGVWTLGLGGRGRALLLAAGLAGSALYLTRLGARATDARLMAPPLAALAAVAVTAVAFARPRASAARSAAATVALAALLAVPAAVSADIVRTNATDAQRSGAMRGDWVRSLDGYLTAHRSGTRYAFGSIAPAKAAPLIALDPQPVLMLTSYRSRPLVSVAQVQAAVRAGEVRYFVLGRRCTSALTAHTAACPAAARWVLSHSTDVTRAAGIPRHGLVYSVKP
jgi:4-amino-4-deoxy-L-arabinose transferase-like glycosyltransferase